MAGHDNSTAKALKPFLCGGACAVTASIIVHPVDLIKVHLQLAERGAVTAEGAVVKFSAFSMAKNVVANEGVAGLYAGLSAAILRQAVYGTARLGLHRTFSDKMTQDIRRKSGNPQESLPAYLSSLSAIASGALAATIGCPTDVALVRMQADAMEKDVKKKREYRNVFNAVIRIAREEGPTTLFRGLQPLICRGASINLGMMATYDISKEWMVAYRGGDDLQTQLAASALSGAVCSWTSLPFDFVKSRLMNMNALPSGQMQYKGLMDCCLKTVKKDGVLSLWRGYTSYYCRTAPIAMIQLLTLEQFNRAYDYHVLRPRYDDSRFEL
eukprot:g18627.t1